MIDQAETYFAPEAHHVLTSYELLDKPIVADEDGMFMALDTRRYPELREAQNVDRQVLHDLFGPNVSTREQALHRLI